MTQSVLLRFVHITDTHISHDPHYNENNTPHTPLVGAKALVHQLKALPFTPDFVLHTGDVAFYPVDEAYDTAREVLSQIPYPTYYIPGNHDSSEALQKRFLGISNPAEKYDYTVEVNGVRLICLDSKDPSLEVRGRLTDAQLTWLEVQCKADDPRPILVAIHHNPLKVGIPWWDDFMSLENGDDFHAVLLSAREKIRGVFYGHVHQGTVIYRDGILYASAVSSWYQINAYPGQIDTEYDRYGSPGYSVVTLTANTTFIRRCQYIVEPVTT